MQRIKQDSIVRSDNKVRLSADVLIKAQAIADEWGLQNAKAAVEAVFRKYADDYQYGRQPQFNLAQPMKSSLQSGLQPISQPSDAASELDGLLGL